MEVFRVSALVLVVAACSIPSHGRYVEKSRVSDTHSTSNKLETIYAEKRSPKQDSFLAKDSPVLEDRAAVGIREEKRAGPASKEEPSSTTGTTKEAVVIPDKVTAKDPLMGKKDPQEEAKDPRKEDKDPRSAKGKDASNVSEKPITKTPVSGEGDTNEISSKDLLVSKIMLSLFK
jgi:hypothetical protein